MLRDFFFRRRRKLRSSTSVARRRKLGMTPLATEQLEDRALLTATPLAAQFIVNQTIFGSQDVSEVETAIGITPDGEYVVAFHGNGVGETDGIFARRYDADGNALADAAKVNTYTSGSQSQPTIGVASDGSYLIAWSGRGAGDRQGIFAQKFSSDATASGSPMLVNTTVGGDQEHPDVAVTPAGAAVVVWNGNGTGDFAGIFGQLISAAGAKVGTEFRVNTTTTNEQNYPVVAIDDTGRFVVAWSSRHQDGDDWGIFAQRFAADGTALGAEFQVNTTTTSSQTEPAIAMAADGQFVITWSDRGDENHTWDIRGQRYAADGSTSGTEFLVNSETEGIQRQGVVGMADDGQFFVAWTSGSPNGSGWEVMGRTFDSSGAADDVEFLINTEQSGNGSGNQRSPVIALADSGSAVVLFSGQGTGSSSAIFGQRFEADLGNQAPQITAIADQTASVGVELVVAVAATDANAGDTLSFTLDPAASPATATITKLTNTTAEIRWTPTAADRATPAPFRVIVEDNGTPVGSDSEQFEVTVNNDAPVVDLNGADASGIDFAAVFNEGSGAVVVVDTDLSVSDTDDTTLQSARAAISSNLDGTSETLSVDTTGTSITSSFNATTGVLALSGSDTLANYRTVLATLSYNNTATIPNNADRRIDVTVNDGIVDSLVARSTITINRTNRPPTANNDTIAVAPGASNVTLNVLVNDSTSPDTGETLTITGIGTQPNNGGSVSVTSGGGSLTYTPANGFTGTETFTYIVSDGNGGTDEATVTINIENQSPALAVIPSITLLSGSPMMIPLDGFDPEGEAITYSATSTNAALVAPTVQPTSNRSLRMSISSPGNSIAGDMVFYLYENLAPRATEHIISLAQSNFYNGAIFHRVINNFIIQSGDPVNDDGTGGSTLGDFDDQFHFDLQHNRTGVLSMAKSFDDTNDSQFFIVEGADSSRHLDFNHTIFGLLVEGEDIREAISNVSTNASNKPLQDVTLTSATVFADIENGVLMLKAPEGTSGTASITVTAMDASGNMTTRTFAVSVTPDTQNGQPFLSDIPVIEVPQNGSTTFQLVPNDVEGETTFVYLDDSDLNTLNASIANPSLRFPVASHDSRLTYSVSDTGEVTVNVTGDLTGDQTITLALADVLPTDNRFDYDMQNVTIRIT